MTTRRERLERKLEKRLDWAAAREAKSDAAHNRVHEIADMIPFGQPILVGHHSEGRARRDQARIENGMRAAIDNADMAKNHAEKASGIERQLRTSIFSDDVNAVEALKAKVARLEEKRDAMKAANAAFRKEHGAELKKMGAYERSRSVPYPSYAITNLGATIRTARERIKQVTFEQAAREPGTRLGGRVMASKYPGECPECGQPFERGTMITWYRSTREAVHVECPA